MAPKRLRSSPAVTAASLAPKKARTSTPISRKLISRTVRERKTVAGVVLTCGQGDTGQLGLGPDIMEKSRLTLVPNLENVVDICAGGMHTVCLTSAGEVFTFGCDDDGALGRNATDEDAFKPGRVELEKPALQISAGDSHSAAILEGGRVMVWGCFNDSHGKMGLTSPNDVKKLPIEILLKDPVEKIVSGAHHLLLMTVKGELWSCGCPEQGQLGRIPARSASRDSVRKGMSAFLEPQLISFRRRIIFKDVWACPYGTFALTDNQEVLCFGLNNYNQLLADNNRGDGPIWAPINNGPLNTQNWGKITGGDHHTVLLNSNGQVSCLGRKEYGRLGLGEAAGDANDPTIVPALANIKCVDIACGSSVSFAVTQDGVLYGWGMGTNGQLSQGNDDADAWTPIVCSAKALENRKVLLVAAGGQHTVALASL